MMYKILVAFLFFGVFQCDRSEIDAETGLSGEWHYVGTFSHLADYKCFVCDDYDYDKSLYRIRFSDANNYTAKINLLNAKGEYNVSFENSDSENMSGTFENLNLQILNKPYETEADGKFQAMFLEATNFGIVPKQDGQKYDQLMLGSNNSEYLLFVRK
ncbi:MAG TPA: hypothetical protein VK175_15300 [Leadbetterella sp.]|nr:hypothetical protein [Leadbetterella sp.]